MKSLYYLIIILLFIIKIIYYLLSKYWQIFRNLSKAPTYNNDLKWNKTFRFEPLSWLTYEFVAIFTQTFKKSNPMSAEEAKKFEFFLTADIDRNSHKNYLQPQNTLFKTSQGQWYGLILLTT